jgi:hypothetical protein
MKMKVYTISHIDMGGGYTTELVENLTGFISLTATHRTWFAWIKDRLAQLGREKRGDVVPYANPKREVQ